MSVSSNSTSPSGTSAIDHLTTLTPTNMVDPSTPLTTLPTSLSTALTTMTSTLMSSTSSSASPFSVTTNLTTLASSTLPLSTSSPSVSTLLITQTASIISSAIPYSTQGGDTFNNTTMSTALLDEERRRYLEQVQEDTTMKLIPTMVFLAILGVIGLLGNSMVLLVYSKKLNRNATDIFIMAIAAFDLCTNVLAIPGEIYDTFHFYDFDSPVLCKVRVYLNTFTTLTSALALLAVAFSRYRKVCRPFGKQTSLRSAKITTAVIALATSLFAVPQIILNGLQTKPTPRPDVFGKECSTDDTYLDTMWPLLYTGFFMLLFLSVCIPLIVFYVLIGVQAWRHSKIHGIPIIHKTPTTSDHTMSDTLDSTDDTDRKSKTWSFFKKKKKYDITPGASSNDEVEGDGGKAEVKCEQKQSCEERSVDKSSHTKMMCSPTKDKSHVNIPMLRELSVKLSQIRDSEISTDEDKDTDEEAEKSKSQVSNEISPLLKNSNDPGMSLGSETAKENCQNENSTSEQMSDFAASMQWVDITYCLNEEAKTEEQHESTDDGSSRKKSSQSARVSRQNSLRQKLSDTLTRAKKAKKESIALNEMEKPPNSTTSTPEGSHENNHITFHETISETNGDIGRKRELKSCDSSSRNSPRNVTFKSKSHKRKENPNRRVLTRTTLMLIIISAVYVIAFVPYLVLMSCKMLVANFLENMADAGYATYNIFLRFFFVNSAANAIIYSLCDARFRDQVRKIMKC